jgi:hypothetical protein
MGLLPFRGFIKYPPSLETLNKHDANVPCRNENSKQKVKNIKIADLGPIPTVLMSFCVKRAGSVTAVISALFRTLTYVKRYAKDITRMTSDVLEFNTVAGMKAGTMVNL